jgi:hypothetical protein
MDSKQLATAAHKILKEMGHDVSLGHVYELFSKLSGHKSWNVAKTRDGFSPVISSLQPSSVGEGNYEVKVVNEDDGIAIKKYYRVQANSAKEAEEIVSSYIKYRCEEDDKYLSFHEGVGILADQEDSNSFTYENWEVIDNRYEPVVQ